MTSLSHDPMHLLLELTDNVGHELCLQCLSLNTQPAGTLTSAARDSGSLTPEAAAACELLACELRSGFLHRADGGLDHRQILRRVLVFCRATLVLLPPVLSDWDGRFALTFGADDAAPPQPALYDMVCHAYADRLSAHLQEYDRDDWVDPNVIAGDVANVLDMTIRTFTWHELFDPTYAAVDADGLPGQAQA